MSHVVMLAMPADRDRAERIGTTLREKGCQVLFDDTAPGTPKWRGAARQAMSGPGVMLFLSAAAGGDDSAAIAYRKVIAEAQENEKAICVRLDPAPAAAPADHIIYDMSGWRAWLPGTFALDIADAIRAREGGASLPHPKATRRIFMRFLAPAGILAFVGLVASVLGIRAYIKEYVPSPEEEAAWQALHPGSCEPLKRFRRDFPQGVHKAEADSLWEQQQPGPARRVELEQRHDIRVLSSDQPGAPTREEAIASATARGQGDSARYCGTLAEIMGQRRLLSARFELQSARCQTFASGHTCNLDGRAICRIETYEPSGLLICPAPRR
jgi:hypothetical protein